MTKVLVVEDDVELSSKVRDYLVFEKFSVETVYSGADALQLLESFKYDAIVLDWNLPDLSGLDVCKAFRLKGGNTPVLFLTGKFDIEDKVTGLDAGADDYMTKPFHVRELTSRLRALLRRHATVRPDTLTIGNLSLITGSGKVTKKGQSVQLLPKELAILEFLMRHPDQTFSSKAILESVWPSDSEAGEETVRTYMKTLRRKITGEGEECPIRTIIGMGYILDNK